MNLIQGKYQDIRNFLDQLAYDDNMPDENKQLRGALFAKAVGYDGVFKIDHSPIMGSTKPDGSDGSPFLGLLHSVGYVQGLLQATNRR